MLIAIIAVITIAILAMLGLIGLKVMKGQDSLRSGVKTVGAAQLPEPAFPLAVGSTRDAVYSLALISDATNRDQVTAAIFRRDFGSREAVRSGSIDADLDRVLEDPRAALCQEVNNLPCQARTAEQIDGWTWDPADLLWQKNGKRLMADIVYGEVDGVVLGASTTSMVGDGQQDRDAPVNEIMAFDPDSGRILWTKRYDHPVIFSLDGERIAGVTVRYGDDGDQPQQTNNHMFELVGADAADSEAVSAPLQTDSGSQPRDAIRAFDFGNATWKMQEGDDAIHTCHFVDGTCSPDDETGAISPEIPALEVNSHNGGIIYGDVDGDGYEDAVVALSRDFARYGGNAWQVEYYVWLWDSSRHEAKNVLTPLASSGRCGPRIREVRIVNGLVEYTWQDEADGDSCASGPSGAMNTARVRVRARDAAFVVVEGLPIE
ncbi:hypothetical protein H8R18_01120 [Nanchangia anserum]|uniref:Uncharacterized protein n=1 Tax=Nanchangia anserum TaxID=2692125 RepID=A0A8I0GH00_9ACTO|nr:hypothetical protein [Nanchangia anserum]MBD3689839.1 hypothetical protein [Nanchangia anserum]QOX82007.1 hypothetical protein H8R18_01120 [Nanchangia anserum]